MSHRPFEQALALKLPSNEVYAADSVWELEQYVDLFWPAQHPERERLLRLCADGLDGWLPAERVREEVSAAAEVLDLIAKAGRSRPRFRAINQAWLTTRAMQ
jgi:hypothetical protein